jgi:3',5'-cyclic-AMP phosphodiesterase
MNEGLRIAHLSDIHCGDLRFDHKLMTNCIDLINEEDPDLTVIAGDLSVDGYREQFDEARGYIELLNCRNKVIIAGNHDCRNVGNIYFEELFGPRSSTISFTYDGGGTKDPGEKVVVVAVDSNKADVNDGEVGRHNHRFIASEFATDATLKVFVLHHHLVHVPGTGRERNIVWDAGDVLHALREARVDIVLSGHKHVPYVWPLAQMYLITSGTVSTLRTRGRTLPSFNFIEITDEEISVHMVSSADGSRLSQTLPRWWHHERFSGSPG